MLVIRTKSWLLGLFICLPLLSHAAVFDLEELRGDAGGTSVTGTEDPKKVKKRTNYGPRLYLEFALSSSDPGVGVERDSSNPRSSYSDFDNPVGAQVLAGFRFYRVRDVSVSLEAFYSDLGTTDGNTAKITQTRVVDDLTSIDESQEVKTNLDVQNFGVGFNIGMNIFPRLRGYFRIGAQRWQADYDISIIDTKLGNVNDVFVPQSSVQSIRNDDSSTDLYTGLGFSYKVFKRLYVSADYAKYLFDYRDGFGNISKEEYIETFFARVGYRF